MRSMASGRETLMRPALFSTAARDLGFFQPSHFVAKAPIELPWSAKDGRKRSSMRTDLTHVGKREATDADVAG
jgi:hypothetical protein